LKNEEYNATTVGMSEYYLSKSWTLQKITVMSLCLCMPILSYSSNRSTSKSHKLSMRNTRRSALVGAIFVITSSAFKKSLSLATDVAGIASRRRATSATSRYDLLLAAHQRSGHWLRST